METEVEDGGREGVVCSEPHCAAEERFDDERRDEEDPLQRARLEDVGLHDLHGPGLIVSLSTSDSDMRSSPFVTTGSWVTKLVSEEEEGETDALELDFFACDSQVHGILRALDGESEVESERARQAERRQVPRRRRSSAAVRVLLLLVPALVKIAHRRHPSTLVRRACRRGNTSQDVSRPQQSITNCSEPPLRQTPVRVHSVYTS